MKLASVSGVVVVSFLLGGLGSYASAQDGADYADLTRLFDEFRSFSQQDYQGDLSGYGAAMELRFADLQDFQRRLAALDIGDWPVTDQVDYHLVRAEMNGLEFELRVLRPWVRDPAFYVGGRGGLGRLPRLPIEGGRVAELRSRLQAVPGTYEQARRNLGGGDLSRIPGDLAILAIRQLEQGADRFTEFVAQLAEHHPDLVSDAQAAQAAIDDYHDWLEQNRSRMTAPAGVGVESYDWLMKNVYLFPYTWDEIRTIVELEDNRVITFQRLEENRNRKLPPLRPVASQEERRRSVVSSLERVMDFIRDDEIFTIQDHIVVDEYRQDRLRNTNGPWPDRHDYFFNFSHRESLMEETHEMVGHHFDLLRARNDDRPIRGAREHEGPYDMAVARLEGLAFAFEELLMHAGYLDERPRRAREVAYEQAAFRTVRALSDVYMHSRDWSLPEAMEYAVANAPHGELLDDSPHLWNEMQTTLVHVGWHAQMVVGKIHFMRLFRDRAQQLGDDFVLKEFMDAFYAAGVIPVSLIRWEMTGRDDEIKKLWPGSP
ncbi:MAG TPA: DUF885 family protein [Acidobacteriota bacterium]|nr:DUF885 family protein [Acidobacteriota bacterium]